MIGLSPAATTIFDTAKKLIVPVLVHTGSDIPFSVPSIVIPRAREYPKVKIILSHSGFAILASDAWVTARECPNVYLKTSWSIPNDVEWFNRTIGAERMIQYKISLLSGDGIGPELTEATLRVLGAAQRKRNLDLEIIEYEAGDECYRKNQVPLPDETVKGIRNSHMVAIFEGINDETVMSVALAIGSQGSVRTSTLKAFPEAEALKIIEKLP